MIAFFGTGLLGAGFVRALRKRGEDVHVWNRTHAKAKALEETGAKAFEDPAEAAKGATRVHLTLSDDAAVDEVLERAKGGFSHGIAIVDHTTTSPDGAARRVSTWKARGVSFQHAPVFMGPQNALESTGTMLASGDHARFESLRPHLEKMTGKLVYLGPEEARAASFKLLGNMMLMFLVSGIADVFALARSLGISASEATQLFDAFNPGVAIPGRAKKMAEGDFSKPSWELAMARKDARLMIEAAEKHGGKLAVLPQIAAAMDAYLARGHAADDWTVIAKDALGK